jgi:hypothetical protein
LTHRGVLTPQWAAVIATEARRGPRYPKEGNLMAKKMSSRKSTRSRTSKKVTKKVAKKVSRKKSAAKKK